MTKTIKPEPVWICACVSPRLVIRDELDTLQTHLEEIFGDDYIEHRLMHQEANYEEDGNLFSASLYVFIKCREPKKYQQKLFVSKAIKNVLNSFSDIVPIDESEIDEIKSKTSTIIQDDIYHVNRTGFFMKGDIVIVKKGSLNGMQGIVLEEHKRKKGCYKLLFRLFVRKFCSVQPASNLEFHSSLFRYLKIPVKKATQKAERHTNRIKRDYDKKIKESMQEEKPKKKRRVSKTRKRRS